MCIDNKGSEANNNYFSINLLAATFAFGQWLPIAECHCGVRNMVKHHAGVSVYLIVLLVRFASVSDCMWVDF